MPNKRNEVHQKVRLAQYRKKGSTHLIRRTLAAASATALAGLTCLAAVPATAASAAPSLTRVAADVIPGLSALPPLRATAGAQRISVDVDLIDPHAAQEQALVTALTTKGSPEYHHFLTPAAYAARFRVPAATDSAVERFATAHGLTVERVNLMGDEISLSGTVAQAERTFSVSISDYVWHGLHFYANSNAPAVPAGLGIVGVVGLNSAQRMTTTDHVPPATARHGSTPAQDTCDPTGAVCTGVTTPNDLRSVYDAPAANQGQGQKMAVFGEGDFTGPIKDLRLFEKQFGLPQVPVKVILTDGTDLSQYSDSSGSGEWDLDTQAETGIAPAVQELDLYFGTSLSDASVGRMFSVWADDPNGPLQANASFGECEYNPVAGSLPSTAQFAAGQAFTVQTEQALTQANAEGRTLFASAGDTGSSCPVVPVDVNGIGNEAFPDVNYPCASPHAVCVGGTVLYTTGGDTEATPDPTKHATRVLEYSWTYTGGGTSVVFPEPTFQSGVSTIVTPCLYDDTGTPYASPTTCRAVPDVAAQSGDVITNGYSIYSNGSLTESGGTSLSSPLNVGMWTLDQAAAPAGGNGFADPVFYKHPSDFFDIGGGPSSPPTGNGYFISTPGWDYTSGLGVQDVSQLQKAVDGGTTPTDDVASPNTGTTTVVDPSGTVVSSSGSGSGGTTSSDPACVALFTGQPNAGGFPNGAQSYPQLDILQGDMHLSADGKSLETILTIQNMQEGVTAVPPGGGANEYYMTWSWKGTTYFTNTEVSAAGTSFNYGQVQKVGASNQYSNSGTATGKVVDGPNGTITVTVPLASIGAPAVGDTLTSPAGATYVEVGVPTVGGSLQPDDSAGPGNDYQLGEICAATGLPGSSGGAAPSGGTVPEAPLAVGLPLLGLGVAGGLLYRRRRRPAGASVIGAGE
jgi:pseudomonalisin